MEQPRQRKPNPSQMDSFNLCFRLKLSVLSKAALAKKKDLS